MSSSINNSTSAYLWISLPRQDSVELVVALDPDRTVREVFDDILESRRGTEQEIPMEHVFEVDGTRHRVELNWELSIPVGPDGCLVVLDEESGLLRRKEIVDSVSSYDQMMIPPDVPVRDLGLPDGVLIVVEDWVAL